MAKFSLRSQPRENQVKMTRAWIPKVTERNQNHPVPWRTSRIRAFYHLMMKKMEIHNNKLFWTFCDHHWQALARQQTVLCIACLQLTSGWPFWLIRTNWKEFPMVECKFYKIARNCFVNQHGRGEGNSSKYYTGRPYSEVQPLTLLYTILDRKGTPFINLL